MKLFRTLGALMVVAIVAGLLAGCAAAPASTAKKFVIASDASWPPMESVDANKNIVGFDIDLINAIAKDQKFQVEIKNTAWDGIFAGLEGGAYDAILSSVTITDDRKKSYDFSDPYFDANQAIVVRSDDPAIKGEGDLAGKKVGTQIGTTGAIYVADKIKEATLKQYDTPDLAMMDLLNKNIDAVIVDTPVAANYALQAEQFKGKLKMVAQIVTDERYGLTVQKGDPKKFLALFNAGLKDIKASGEYDKIYQKWISGGSK
jgi:polar amino acid transport system substrate-binding protein